MKSIIIIIDYFGNNWPEWFPIFLESCRYNSTIKWLFHTDCDYKSFDVENVEFKYISKEDYVKVVNDKLSINFPLNKSYKLCDIRPTYGELYEEEIKGYDFYGFGDIDVIYGNIRKFYTDKVLENNVLSTHDWCISGHLCLLRNVKWLRKAFRKIKNWREYIENPKSQRFDEDVFVHVFKDPGIYPRKTKFGRDYWNPFQIKYHTKLYFKEQYSTPLTPITWIDKSWEHPKVWYWRDGKITNELDGDIEFMYLHFMNYRYARWMDSKYGKKGFWQDLDQIVHVRPEEITKGIRIDPTGIHPIDKKY